MLYTPIAYTPPSSWRQQPQRQSHKRRHTPGRYYPEKSDSRKFLRQSLYLLACSPNRVGTLTHAGRINPRGGDAFPPAGIHTLTLHSRFEDG
jgi:hypothetical protein